MVLDYLHVSISYKRLLRLLQVRAFGTSFRSLRPLEVLDLSVLLEAGNVQALRSHLENGLPPILFINTGQLEYWRYEPTGHAVVVIGIEGEHAYVNDPGFPTAPQVASLAELELAWLDKDYLYAVIQLA